MVTRTADILVLCKTYPSPSSKYSETSCVAGMEETGSLIRLFPVPFRLIKDDQQFKKWEIIEATIERARDDNRPESHHIKVDTIRRAEAALSTKNGWAERWKWIDKVSIFSDFAAVEKARQVAGNTLSLLRPAKIVALDITPTANPDWTPQEQTKLLQHQRQAGLFDDADAPAIKTLRKLPYDFHYRYQCTAGGIDVDYRHKIVDWEIGALYWNCRRQYGKDWEPPFRAKLERDLPAADLMFLMGTIHRFPDQWLIVSLIYPPKRQLLQTAQRSLFDL
ncbi:MAG: hypothetical protein E5X23_27675 [Mesorhizobium sp.]|uniref:hypothetical protein n=1 Tax=unclassified Mesorhizobium TaxID=325217 RepID=UPI000FCAD8FD|nr:MULTISPECIES: hypothetical protein [unclassified Mesorhizobium]RUV41828.1 hypothetical protein EOD29_22425 [Mesorhizobium sp. M1A.T.Ca.IN.004.03.1.1]RWH50352.1 MAG: hypothetical protein EOQ81_25510 [Mesorhizobium sp.]RWK37862.1 MAG: hypothetical protein EOR40_10735 [Mesorhizobium sp.]RWK85485.1 MAG: hypothetical protein EOR52_27035 [Mesorhizobium sp.]TIP15699.1 MAG: hypothetical protein E5X66_28875 [Mesorhizobium sp.]